MIEQKEAMSILVQACPSFAHTWQTHVREHGNDLQYAAAGEFASHLLSLYEAQDTSCFPAVAEAVERLRLEGSTWVKEFATVGILEAVQNVWWNKNADPESFGHYLGTESRRQWQNLTDAWEDAAPLGGVG